MLGLIGCRLAAASTLMATGIWACVEIAPITSSRKDAARPQQYRAYIRGGGLGARSIDADRESRVFLAFGRTPARAIGRARVADRQNCVTLAATRGVVMHRALIAFGVAPLALAGWTLVPRAHTASPFR